MAKTIISEKYGPKSASDSVFAAKARFLQSWYRANKLNENNYGFGPEENSTIKYGNILVNGKSTGNNFLMPEIFEYTTYRTKFLKNGETLKEYRLFNNMLSSQPMCFNLFYPLKALFDKDAIKATEILKACFPSLQIATLLSVEIEFLPYPITEYLNDRTVFDAMLIYKSVTGARNIVAIETKYVESLGVNPSSDLKRQIALVNNCNLFNDDGKMRSVTGYSQLGRNFLSAEKFREQNRLDKAFAIVISPKENSSSKREIEEFHMLMQPAFHDRLFHETLENVVKKIKSSVPKPLDEWIDNFEKRYLFLNDNGSTPDNFKCGLLFLWRNRL